MSNFEAMQKIADRYISDPEFREQMASDPEGAAKSMGVTLDDTTWQTLQSVSGEALSRRVSKLTLSWC